MVINFGYLLFFEDFVQLYLFYKCNIIMICCVINNLYLFIYINYLGCFKVFIIKFRYENIDLFIFFIKMQFI